ncbi:MAG: fibronectin type III domain-containing protein, partial [Paludibacteraceae bacterium]|nr:fibronectin type III domain-containing protein [Paludibacteraceae bacterium]
MKNVVNRALAAKKRFFLFLLTAFTAGMMGLRAQDCEGAAIPFTEDFESYSSGATVVGCWTLRNYGGSGYPKVLNLSSGAQSGNMLELFSTKTTHRSLAAMPSVDGNLSQMVLSFTTRSWSTSAQSVLYVGTMGDFDDPTTFVPLDTFYNANGNKFTVVHMDLANYTLAYNNIVFTSGLGETLEMNSDVMVDNVSLKPNTCIEAWDIEATDIQPNSIDITWQGKSSNNQWIIQVQQNGTPVVSETTISRQTYHLDQLIPVTTYTFYIRPVCDTTWSSVSYRTACVPLDPTKSNKETFESCASGTSYNADYQHPCWTTGNANPGTGTSYLPYVYMSTSYSSSGTNSYRAYGTATYGPAYIASPEIDCEKMSDISVTFNVYAAASYWWICGVMSDPEDINTFVVLDSVKGTGKSEQYQYDLSEYADMIPEGAKHFAWRTRYGAADYLYLDDVSFEKMNCELPKLRYTDVTYSSARIRSGLHMADNWILKVTQDTTIVFYDTIWYAGTKVLNNLEEQTTYSVSAASLCDAGTSPWASTSFKTPCKPVTPEAMGTITFSAEEGYVSGTGASRYLPCWTVGNKSGNASPTSSYIPYVGTSASYKHNGLNYLNIYSYVTSSTSYDGAYAIMPELDVEDISKYQVNFWARTTSSTGANYHDNLVVGIISDPNDLSTFAPVDTLTLSHTAYEPFTIAFDKYQGGYLGIKGRYIMFLAETGDIVTSYSYAYVSEISVEKIPTCRPVTEFTVDSIAEDAAKISWKQYSDSYRMLVADKEVAEKDK